MKRSDSNGGHNWIGHFSTGALRPPHPRRLGAAFLLLMKLEDAVTVAEGTDGLVFGGAPVSDRRIAGEMGIARSTVIEWRRRLVGGGYIVTQKTDRGFRVRVRNSVKAWLLQRPKAARSPQSISPVENQTPTLSKTLHPPVGSQTPPVENPTAYKEDLFSKTDSEKTKALKPPAPAKKPPTPVRQATDYAHESFRRHFGQPPSWSKADYAQAAALFKRLPGLAVEEFVLRWERYLDSTETFTQNRGASLKYFCSNFDRFIRGPVHDAPARKGSGNGKCGFSVQDQAEALGARPRPAN